MGEGRRRSRVAVWGRGVHKGHFQLPVGMVVRGGRRQFICHPALHICHKRVFCVRQTDLHILGSEGHPVEARI